jgi:hypothetical protein
VISRWAAIAAAVLIAAGAFEPHYFTVFATNRAAARAALTELPYRKTPGLRVFLEEVRARTRDGDTIAIAAPFAHWDGGYEYVYARATYALAGRRVLPVIDASDRPLDGSRAGYIAAYRIAPQLPQFAVVWRGRDGVLLRRQR